MSRQPKEDWCPYCREEVERWEARRKRSPTRNPNSTQKIRSNVKYWFLCPHCEQKHPWWQYEWMQAIFLAVGILSVGAINGFQRDRIVYTIGIGVAIAMVLTLVFRFGYVWYVYRDRPEKTPSINE